MINISPNKKTKRRIGINITPFVDVVLSLLIVFVISVPMFTGNVEINLPEASSRNSLENPKLSDPIIIAINKDEKIYLADEEVTKETLLQKLELLLQENKDSFIYIKGDKVINYGKVIELLAFINAAGFSKVSLLTTEPLIKTP